jgi:AraC family L-rhamnose operon regulatory protein RhaS
MEVLHDPAATDIERPVKSTFPSPIYQSGADRLEIDTCAPQLKAMREGKIELHALSKGHYPGNRMNSNILPGLTNVGFWNCRGDQDWGLDAHRNEGLEIVLLETGGMAFEVDGRSHELHAGNLTITRPWQLHKLGGPNIGRGRLCWLILDVGVRRPNQEWTWPSWVVLESRDLVILTRKLRHGEQSVWMANARVREVFRDLADCVLGWKEPGVISRLTVAVNRLLVELLDVLAEQQLEESPELVSRRRTVELFLKDLEANPGSSAEAWTLESMANQCGMGITAMVKYCRELVNNGPMAYLNRCRLDHAARALRGKPGTSVTEIAMWAGFNSSQYFATLFRKRYQMTPVEYRARAGWTSVGTKDLKPVISVAAGRRAR